MSSRLSRPMVWARRYVPLEVAATAAALVGSYAVLVLSHNTLAAAFAGSISESIGFYATAAWREYQRASARSLSQTGRARRLLLVSREMAFEFGPAEVLDTLFVRSAFMYLAQGWVDNFAVAILLGKVASDVVFYGIAIVSFELRTRMLHKRNELTLQTTTPRLEVDLSVVENAYRTLAGALGETRIHYAMKCNPHPAILQKVRDLGGSFEIASATELDELIRLRVDASEVLFSNPVKPSSHIERAAKAGVRRYAFDSEAELDKLARWAPGCEVYVRLAVQSGDSDVASEGKFGVDVTRAGDLLLAARQRGLHPIGIAFHVGSQMLDSWAWDPYVEQSAQVMTRLQAEGIVLTMLNIGGGFPAFYGERIPELAEYGERIAKSLDAHLPYDIKIVAEPGRALVAAAGVMCASVIGLAERNGKRWVHLDVGAFNGMMESLETNNELRYPMTDSRASSTKALFNVTGPSCDSQDTIVYGAPLSHDLKIGDLVRIESTGAYTTSYASAFNGFDIPPTLCSDANTSSRP